MDELKTQLGFERWCAISEQYKEKHDIFINEVNSECEEFLARLEQINIIDNFIVPKIPKRGVTRRPESTPPRINGLRCSARISAKADVQITRKTLRSQRGQLPGNDFTPPHPPKYSRKMRTTQQLIDTVDSVSFDMMRCNATSTPTSNTDASLGIFNTLSQATVNFAPINVSKIVNSVKQTGHEIHSTTERNGVEKSKVATKIEPSCAEHDNKNQETKNPPRKKTKINARDENEIGKEAIQDNKINKNETYVCKENSKQIDNKVKDDSAEYKENIPSRNTPQKSKIPISCITPETPGRTRELIRKWEAKGCKVAAAREAAEKKKLEIAVKAEKEKEEKFKQLLKEKEERLKDAQLKKKRLAAQKLAEVTERRKQEEAARLARLKEIEEEKKRILAIKMREQQDAEKLRLQKQEELKALEAEKLKEKNKVVISKVPDIKTKVAQVARDSLQSYDIISIEAEDSTDDESKPKKAVPRWAERPLWKQAAVIQCYIPSELSHMWFYNKQDKVPSLRGIFPENKKRPRTSSAVWNSRICFDPNGTFSGI